MSVSDRWKLDEVTEQFTLVSGWAARIPLRAGVAHQAAEVLPVRVRAVIKDLSERGVALLKQARAPTFRTVQ